MSKKILIVDDEPEFLEMLKIRLEANGYEVVCASDGWQGFELVKKDKPDLVILDIVLPDISGFYACKKCGRVALYSSRVCEPVNLTEE